MHHFQTKLNSAYNIVIYFALYRGKPIEALPPGAKVVWEDQQLVILHDNFAAAKQTSYELRNKIRPFYFRLFTNGSLDANQRAAISQLGETCTIVELDSQQVNRILQEIKEFGAKEVDKFFRSKIPDIKRVMAFIVKDSHKKELESALKGERKGPPSPRSYIVRRDQLLLPFNGGQLIRMQLLLKIQDVLELYFEEVRLEGRDNKLYAVGPPDKCANFKQYIESMMGDCEFFTLQISDPMTEEVEDLNKKMPSSLGATVFTSDEVLFVCQDMHSQYRLSEPMEKFEVLQKQFKMFIMVCCKKINKQDVELYVKTQLRLLSESEGSSESEEPAIKKIPAPNVRQSQTRQVQKPQKKFTSDDDSDLQSDDSDRPKIVVRKKEPVPVKEMPKVKKYVQKPQDDGYQIVTKKREKGIMKQVANRTVMMNEYDEHDMNNWFRKNEHVGVENLLVMEKEDEVTVVLTGSKENTDNPKFVEAFQMYFSYTRVIFFKEQEVEPAVKEMRLIKKQNPTYDIQFVEGFCPYKYAELNKQDNIKKQIGYIKKNNIKEGGRNCHPFRCILFVGVHNIGRILEERIREAIRQEGRQLDRAQEWSFKLEPLVMQSASNPKLKELIERKVRETVNKSDLMKVHTIAWGDELKLTVVTEPGTGRQTMDLMKKSLSEMLQDRLRSKRLEYKTTVTELQSYSEISRQDYIFVYKPDGVHMAGFDVEAQIHLVNSVIQSKKVQQTIKFELHLQPLVREYIAELKVQHKEEELLILESVKGDDCVLNIKGLVVSVKTVADSLRQRIEQLEEQMSAIYVTVSQEEARVVKEHGILDNICRQFSVKARIGNEKFEDLQIGFQKGTVIMTQRRYNRMLSGNYLLLVFNEKDMLICSGSKKHLKRPEEPYALSNDGKVCLLRSIQDFTKTLKQIRNEREVIVHPPEGVELRQFFIDLLRQLEDWAYSEPFSVYICSRSSQPSTEYQELCKEIQTGKLEQKVKAGTIVWSWQDKNVVTPYSAQAQAKISDAYEKGLAIVELNEADLMITEPTHLYNKRDSTLKHLMTGTVSRVAKLSPIFYKFEGSNGTNQIPVSQITKIESSTDNEVKLILYLYKIDLTNMVQTNLYTGFQRKVVKQGDVSVKQINPLQNAKIEAVVHAASTIEIGYHSSQKNVSEEKVSARLKEQLSNYRTTKDTVEINTDNVSPFELIKLCHEYGVQMDNLRSKGNISMVDLKAFNKKDNDIIKQKLKLLQYQKSKVVATVPEIEYPKDWKVGSDDIQLYDVAAGTAEYNRVLLDFKIGPIKRLRRVENKLMWKKYKEEVAHLEYITGERGIRELFLFHGTRTHPPSGVYNDKEESFNINYSSESNYFGRGIYFAKEAKYSLNYSHPDPSGLFRSMLYCRVLVGTSQEMQKSQRSNSILDTAIRDPLRNIKFESIHSNYDGSDIYIVYKSRRAYPEYVIDF